MVDVFISYSREDLGPVTRLAEAVEAEGYEVWWDADLPPHLSYGDVITAKIGMAKAAIVVWSKQSAASEWVRAEADMARNQKKLVQTALGDVMPPLPFNQIQFAEIGDWRGEPDHPGWRKVKASLAELCGREGEAAPARGEPIPAPRPAASPPSKWPLYAGLGVAAIALLGAAWVVLRDAPGEAGPEAAPPLAQSAATVTKPVAEAEAAVETVLEAPAAIDAPAAPEPAPAISSTEGMVIPDSNRRLLTQAEIAGYGPSTLAIAWREIYARKGFRLRDPEMHDYFSQFAWYRPVRDEVRLTAIERQNVALLRKAEARYGGGGSQVP